MKRISLLVCLLFAFICVAGQVSTPKYMFLFIGDGMATPQRMIAEEYALKVGHGKLTINHLPHHGTTRTVSANSLVTDSAAAGTAIACGEKTNNGRLGMDVSGKRKLESIAQVAQKKGYRIGVVSSVTINHATPGAFYAHRPSRAQYYDIGLDLINSNYDYFAGGGFGGNVDDKKNPNYRGNLYEAAAKAGYKVVSTPEDFRKLKPGDRKVLARGSERELPYALDAAPDAVNLAEFTRKGIELLDNPNGFFMMVEGGSIDWCGHSNDAATNLKEVLELDLAVREALKFAEKHPEETLIVVTGDHETGGMTMGFAGTGYNLFVERLANQKCSIGGFGGILANARKAKKDFSFEDTKPLLTKYFGFQFQGNSPMRVNDAELKNLKEQYDRNRLPDAARRLISAKAGVGWTSGAHTALPVLTTSIGPAGVLFTGFLDNTDISKSFKKLLRQ